MNKCVVFGSNGFIGSHLCQTLQASGRTVLPIGRAQSPSTFDEYLQVLNGADEVIDLAYASVPKSSYTDPLSDLTDNLPRIVMMFQAAVKTRPSKIMMISTGGAIYGHKTGVLDETTLTHPVSPYGITKLAVENYARFFHDIEGLPILVARPGNAYGPGQIPFRGQGLVATAYASALNNREIVVFGGESIIRDYIHVSDLVSGLQRILDFGAVGQTYNIGTAIGTSTSDLLSNIGIITQHDGYPLQLNHKPHRPFDVLSNILNHSLLTRDTGWTPKIKLDVGLQSTWQWYLENRRLEK